MRKVGNRWERRARARRSRMGPKRNAKGSGRCRRADGSWYRANEREWCRMMFAEVERRTLCEGRGEDPIVPGGLFRRKRDARTTEAMRFVGPWGSSPRPTTSVRNRGTRIAVEGRVVLGSPRRSVADYVAADDAVRGNDVSLYSLSAPGWRRHGSMPNRRRRRGSPVDLAACPRQATVRRASLTTRHPLLWR